MGCHSCWSSYFKLVFLWCWRTGARASGHMVTWLPKFHGWIGNQFSSLWGSAHARALSSAKRHRWEGKVQKNAQFSFSGLREAFLYKIVVQGTRTQEKIFFTADRSACPILKRNQAPKFLENFQVHFVLYSQEITFLKESLPCICKYFILDVLYVLRLAWAPWYQICVE